MFLAQAFRANDSRNCFIAEEVTTERENKKRRVQAISFGGYNFDRNMIDDITARVLKSMTRIMKSFFDSYKSLDLKKYYAFR